jgi:hypothetical protein
MSRALRDSGGDLGDLFYVDPDGIEVPLPIPADWADQLAAGTPYVLGILDGHPAWVPASSGSIGGFGNGFGSQFGQD